MARQTEAPYLQVAVVVRSAGGGFVRVVKFGVIGDLDPEYRGRPSGDPISDSTVPLETEEQIKQFVAVLREASDATLVVDLTDTGSAVLP